MATTDQDRHDTKDRFAVVLERLENLKSQQTGNADDVFAAMGAKDKLVEELGAGDYFAKTSDIFPKGDALPKIIKDIQGMADKFQREAQLEDYNEQRNGFKRHLADAENQSLPDDGSVAASVASVSIRTEAKADGDPTACLVEGLPGHRGHQGSGSKNCSGWWALVYVWMIGNLAELDALVNEISAEKDSDKKKALEDRLHKSLLMLANGTKGGTAGKGMRSNDRNILFVPNPHDDYYDGGCNWIIYPIMTSGDMLVWDGKPYWVAIFCGENLPGAGPQGKDLWVDGPSAKTAREGRSANYQQNAPQARKHFCLQYN
ncbi:unknown protein [Seminavis robusta]|uniref:Uncharacterized protein n=1 Tax=Seminavis robusta TaxID=568900 RepID=A0A9N8F5E4_9STRA|nr:unknown protein [Seminavis robusta]|eukprot:Sro3300_g346410.1 n/a (317) ;mRNA; r:452-1402